jgi:hypothetical protein
MSSKTSVEVGSPFFLPKTVNGVSSDAGSSKLKLIEKMPSAIPLVVYA